MISRRHIRIKVMQALYAGYHMDVPNMELAVKNLFTNTRNVYVLYLYQLLLIQKTAEYVRVDAQIKAAKYLPTDEDRNFSSEIIEHPFIQFLKQNFVFNDLIGKEKLVHHIDDGLVRSLYQQWVQLPAYKQYLASPVPSAVENREVISEFYKSIILTPENTEHHFEDLFSNWQDDKDLVANAVIQTIEELTDGDRNQKAIDYFRQMGNMESEKTFASELFRKTIEHEKELSELISPKLVNWAIDRVAVIDLILMKMALCEIIYFDNIPIKVSMNEYIDISKIYSTPQSREFINGILDKVMKELKEGGKIVKAGRGLVE